jgi:hypothetical protein
MLFRQLVRDLSRPIGTVVVHDKDDEIQRKR